MATLALALVHACSGNNHFRFTLSVDGNSTATVDVERSEIIDTITKDDVARLVAMLVRIHAKGKTLAQAKSNLQAGVSITV